MPRALPFAFLALAVAACTADEMGTIDLSLTGQSSSGVTYRLREAELLLTGPGTSEVYLTETDPNRPSITARLPAGAYNLGLANGWHLERMDAGVGVRVNARLESPNPMPFTITAGALKRAVLLFDADGVAVPVGDGDLEIDIGVNDVDAGAPSVDAATADAAAPIDAAPSADAIPNAPQAEGDDMQPGEVLAPGTFLTSPNGVYRFQFQTSGELAVFRSPLNTKVWSAPASGPAQHCIMQLDGNLVLYRSNGQAVWATNTFLHAGSVFRIRNNGPAIINPSGTIIWSINLPLP